MTVDSKLKVAKVEGKQPQPQYVKFSKLTWTSGKASIELTTKETGVIEYKIGTDGIYQAGTTISNLSNGDIVYVRVNNNGTYTDEETLEIKDTIEPEKFTIEASDITYEGVKLTGSTQDLQTGIKDYTYVAATKTNEIVKEIENQTVTEYQITGLKENTEYVVYMLAYDNAGNVRKSNEVTVRTKQLKISTFDFSNDRNDFQDIKGNCVVDENGIKGNTYESSTDDVWDCAITKRGINMDLYSKFEIVADILLENNDTNYKMGGIAITFCKGEDIIFNISLVDGWQLTQWIGTYIGIGTTEIYHNTESKVQASGEYKIVSDGNKIKALLNDTILGEIDYNEEIRSCDSINVKFQQYPSHSMPETILKKLTIKTQL